MLLAKDTYELCTQLPRNEAFGLISQMQRCAVSIPSNLAEGSKRATRKDFKHFVVIAKGSAAELETQIILAESVYDIDGKSIIMLLEEVQKMLEKLAQHLSL